jgi:hypothetical protein
MIIGLPTASLCWCAHEVKERAANCRLIIGLVRNNNLDPNQAEQWARMSRACRPELDKELMADAFLRYKGAEAGEIDWRPTETTPEDYYAF